MRKSAMEMESRMKSAAKKPRIAKAAAKSGHVKPCGRNFRYEDVSKGDPKGLKMILDEIRAGL